MRHAPAAFFSFFIGILLASCSSYVYKEAYPMLVDGKYDSEFPYRSCSKQLEEISETVKRVTSMAHYKNYSFALADSVRSSDISRALLDRSEASASYQHHATAGTGLVISSENGRLAMITCAHVVDFADTVVVNFIGTDYRPTPFIKSIAIKTNQMVFLNDVAGGMTLDVLAIDRTSDLTVLGQKLDRPQAALPPVFMYPVGRGKELEWGSFVYVFGYPAGYRMITKGIVSLPTKGSHGSFIVDAVISPGSSGSIALAVRDGVPNFELVGIIKMVPSQSWYVLTPPKNEFLDYDPSDPYRGDVFVERKAELQQGIALAIPAETIVAFIQGNLVRLADRGFDLSNWLRPRKVSQSTTK